MTAPDSIVDVTFPVTGTTLPRDHGYLLFSAIAEHVPRMTHEPGWGLHLVRGREDANRRIELDAASAVGLRIPAAELGEALILSGRTLAVGCSKLELGVAKIRPLTPAKLLRGVVVLPGPPVLGHAFWEAVRRELAALPLEQNHWEIGIWVSDERIMAGRTRTVMGHAVDLSGLRPHASLVIQAHGIGARRYMGAGVFSYQGDGR